MENTPISIQYSANSSTNWVPNTYFTGSTTILDIGSHTHSIPPCADIYPVDTHSYPLCANDYSILNDHNMVTSMAMEAIRPFIIMVLLVLIETIKNGTTNEEIVRSIEDLARLTQRSTLKDITKLLVDFEEKKKKEVPMDGELLKLVSKLE
jgi:hypothetical protein